MTQLVDTPEPGGDTPRWLDEARGGSGEALGRLIEACRPYLLPVADRELAPQIRGQVAPSDLVQETLLRAQGAFGSFGGRTECELLAWLRAILRNAAVDAFRRFGGREISPDTADTVEVLEPGVADPTPSPTPGGAATPADPPPVFDLDAVPGLLGRFRVVRELGRGAGGVVFLAEDPVLGRTVALKVARPEALVSPDSRRRFVQEARVAAGLRHPNLVPVHDTGELAPFCYIVSDYCPGPTLHAWLAGRTALVPPRDAAALVAALADAAHYVHGRGVLHRDIKPGNVLLEPAPPRGDGAPPPGVPGFVPRLTDFGLAKVLGGEAQHTRTGVTVGTPAYMAPEQADGRLAAVGPEADVYGLGAVLYEVLTGQPPFRGATMLDTLRRAASEDPTPPRRLRAGLPRDLEAVCLKCLEKDPARRYPTAGHLADDLRRFLRGEPTRARPVAAAGRALRWAGRRPAVAALAALCGAALLALAAGAAAYHVRLREYNDDLAGALGREQEQRREAEARGRGLTRAAYVDHINLAAEALAAAGRPDRPWDEPVPAGPQILDALPPGGTCLLPDGPAGPAEDLRGFEYYYLLRLGRSRRELRGHRSTVCGLAMSGDGRLCASGAEDGVIQLWDLPSGRESRRLEGHRSAVSSVALSPDGRFLASAAAAAGARGELLVWDTGTGTRVVDLGGGTAGVYAAEFSPDGRLLACVAAEKPGEAAVHLWEVGTWRRRFRWPAGGWYGAPVRFAPDGRTVAAATREPGDSSCALRLWDPESGRPKGVLGPQGSVRSLCFGPDGRTLASGSDEGTITLWDLTAGRKRLALAPGDGSVRGLAFSPDGRSLVAASQAGSRRGSVRWFAPDDGRPLGGPWQLRAAAASLATLPDGCRVAVGCVDGVVRVGGPEEAREARELPGHRPKEAWAAAFSPNGRTLATGGDDHLVRLWDPAAGRQRGVLRGHTCLVSAVAYHPGGRWLATGDYHGVVRLWDTVTGAELATLAAHPQAVRCLTFSPDGRLLATGGKDTTAKLWEVVEGPGGRPLLRPRAILTIRDPVVHCVAFSPDGRTLAAAGQRDKAVYLWDAASGRPLRVVEDPTEVWCVAFAPDGRLAWGNARGEVRLGSPSGEGAPSVLLGHLGGVRALAFSPDGRTLASAGEDREVRLWQASTGQPLLALRGHPDAVYALAFAPDGRRLATACHDGTIRLWEAGPDGE